MRFTHGFTWATGLCLSLSGITRAAQLSSNAQQMLDESMNFMDLIYDADIGYLHYFYYPLAAGTHETRSSAWYAAGLLQRNQNDDAEQGIKILRNIIGSQHKDPTTEWYGDYQYYPEEPTVGTDAYPPAPYGSFDPNWRNFIGTALILIYEEFQSLLPNDLQQLIIESVYNSTVGDTYRLGGLTYGNLNPGYTNPSTMRSIQASWIGRKLNNANLTAFGENWAAQVIELFDRNLTLSEFNSATYTGVTLYALTMWDKYLPPDSIMKQNGARMIKDTWLSLAETYHPAMKNLAGPWDRSYGYDMNQYFSLLALYLWTLLGKENAPVYDKSWSMAHADDLEYAPLMAILASHHDALVPTEVIEHLTTFRGEHTYVTSAYAPPGDAVPRNITSWVSDNLTIGAMSFLDAPGVMDHSQQWNAAVVQWLRFDNSVGFFTLAAGDQHAMDVEVGPNFLNLTYPHGNSTSTFEFILATNPWGATRDIPSLDNVSGVDIQVIGGSVNATPVVSFCGLAGGACSPRFNFEFWNYTWTMPEDSTSLPSVSFEITAT
ncbi:hypothetical protein PV08_07037 [Exophiala spinifera]|uniref:Linalool dehydratase/isomerase domain-containing protein n=1 Tax=Exophiala spinifera TaxID=91928 RepID=A0A0D2B6D6_9EURO|nr:uncharacterized protein PV08_07037 [Exophiala spinifera]KIW14255.1 hypothetical protein PV08_07037 [Exophiala spinifera]